MVIPGCHSKAIVSNCETLRGKKPYIVGEYGIVSHSGHQGNN